MPTIAIFYGITVVMRLRGKEHNPPHVHAFYGKYSASFYISNGEIYKGHFPKTGSNIVKDFILEHHDELLEMWENGTYKMLNENN